MSLANLLMKTTMLMTIALSYTASAVSADARLLSDADILAVRIAEAYALSHWPSALGTYQAQDYTVAVITDDRYWIVDYNSVRFDASGEGITHFGGAITVIIDRNSIQAIDIFFSQ